MSSRLLLPSLFLAASCLFTASVYAFVVPQLKSPVMDQAGFLTGSTQRQLSQALKGLHKNGGSQIQVLTVEHLDGLSIEQASIRVTDAWKLGHKDSDNGVLLMVAKKERKVRIEVGQGLEGRLTDAHSKRIIDEVMLPLFRSGDTNSAILLGAISIAKKTDPAFNLEGFFGKYKFENRRRVKKKQSLLSRIISIIIFIFMIVLFIKNPMLFFLLLSSGRSRGGFGGRIGGGGSWSGGGGGFSGGGASGGW